MCWVSSIIAILLLYGWKEGEYNQCGYIAVVSKEYLYFRHFLFTIIPCTGLIIISIAIFYQIDQVKISYWMLVTLLTLKKIIFKFNKRRIPESIMKFNQIPEVMASFKEAKRREIKITINLSISLVVHIICWAVRIFMNVL